MHALPSWFTWALLSAVFAALTSIFAKVGVEGIDSDLATLVRTFVIVPVLLALVWGTGKWTNPLAIAPLSAALGVTEQMAAGWTGASVNVNCADPSQMPWL